MKKYLIPFVLILLIGCSSTEKKSSSDNPLLSDYSTPFNVPPFDKILAEHYLPAFKDAITEHKKEIDAIINMQEAPNFKNTIVALDSSGDRLSEISLLFFNQLSANTNDTLQDIAKEVSPMLSTHEDDILLNEALFKQVKAVHETADTSSMTTEQKKLLEDTYKTFVRGGANLNEEDKNKLRDINKELSVLTLEFGDNVLAEVNRFQMVIDNKDDLSGLPDGVVEAAAIAATENDMEGKWLFTIQKPSLIPFLQYSEKRDLREKMFKAYIDQGNHNDSLDNKEIIKKIVSLRIKKANLLGFKTHADYVLDINMAKTPANVYNRLKMIWKPSLIVAKKEAVELQKMIKKDGFDFKLEPWDWWYYSEKLRKEKYDLDENELRPYFELENVKKGMFMVANKLYGIKFKPIENIPTPHKDAVAYEVTEADGSHIGVLFQDFYPRASKEGGAWMSEYRTQHKENGKNVPPVITMVMNFTKPTAEKPSLLTVEEVETMFHEFGHTLHGLLSNCTYRGLAGTEVARDFVELPSQIMENWATDPEVLKLYAVHYQTGEPMPDELIQKLENSRYFNQGFITTEYLAASFLDMDWHTLTALPSEGVMEFEKQSMDNIGMIPEIVVRYRSPYFRHIFSGGYSAGYYSYVWAQMLDADAFAYFKETGIFNQKTAKAFRDNILSKGGTEDPMKLYIDFRGKEPTMDALMKRKGFTNL